MFLLKKIKNKPYKLFKIGINKKFQVKNKKKYYKLF